MLYLDVIIFLCYIEFSFMFPPFKSSFGLLDIPRLITRGPIARAQAAPQRPLGYRSSPGRSVPATAPGLGGRTGLPSWQLDRKMPALGH